MQQIELPVLDHGANVRIELPQLSDLGEILDKHLNGQTPLHLELAVDPGLGFLKHLLR